MWIEIYADGLPRYVGVASPSARKVWIEIVQVGCVSLHVPSPSARKVWIEIKEAWDYVMDNIVTFRKEGVD